MKVKLLRFKRVKSTNDVALKLIQKNFKSLSLDVTKKLLTELLIEKKINLKTLNFIQKSNIFVICLLNNFKNL